MSAGLDLDPMHTMYADMGLATPENLSSGFANNNGADQPAHPRSLIRVFVICVLESTISKLATSKISVF